MRNLVFLVATLAFYFGLHLFLYFSTVRLFGLTDNGHRRLVLTAVLALSLSFFVSAVGARLSRLALFDWLYWLGAAWIGWLIYLALGFAAAWLLVLALKAGGISSPALASSLAVAVIVVSLLATGLGVWNGRHPAVKEVTIGLKGLPNAWEGRTVIQLSDLHLGHIHKADFAERIARQVNALDPDIILITGDLFDGMGGDLDSFVAPLNELKAKQGVLFVTGNHEHYLGLKPALNVLDQTGIEVIDGQVKEIDGLQVVGLGFPGLFEAPVDSEIITRLSGFDSTKPNILLYHEPTSVSQKPNGNGSRRSQLYFTPDVDCAIQQESGIDLQLSGHTHAGQFWPFTWLTRAIFRGRDYGLNRYDGFQLYTTSGVGTWGPPLRLGARGEIVVLKLRREQ